MLTKIQKIKVSEFGEFGIRVSLERLPLPLGQKGRKADTAVCGEEVGGKPSRLLSVCV